MIYIFRGWLLLVLTKLPYENWMLKQLLVFIYCLSIQFFYSPPFFNTFSWATFGYLPLTVQHQCYLQDAVPFQWSPDASPYPSREAEDFPGANNHSKYMPLLTYLDWLQPIIINLRYIVKHVKTRNILFLMKILIKTLNSHE